MFLTAEELVVYSASRDVLPPPGVLPVIESLRASPYREGVLELAARTLVTRGIPIGAKGADPTADIDRILQIACSPQARVVVVAGQASEARFVALSLGDGTCVFQSWDQRNLHAFVEYSSDAALGAVFAVAETDAVGPADCNITLTIDEESRDAAVAQGPERVEAVVDSLATKVEDPAVKRSLVEAMAGEGPGVSMIFNATRSDGNWTDAFAWIGPTPSGAWFVRNSSLPGPDRAKGALTFSRVGRSEIEAAISHALSELVGP
jgi:hypothetical protein